TEMEIQRYPAPIGECESLARARETGLFDQPRGDPRRPQVHRAAIHRPQSGTARLHIRSTATAPSPPEDIDGPCAPPAFRLCPPRLHSREAAGHVAPPRVPASMGDGSVGNPRRLG